MSSSFGPRLQTSRDGVYDFHRGIDIPTVMGTPVYAVGDGKVIRAGRYQDFEDVVVQIEHCDQPGACFYSTYIHLTMPVVETGDQVGRGRPHRLYRPRRQQPVPPPALRDPRGRAREGVLRASAPLPPDAGRAAPALSARRTDEDSTSSVSVEVDATLPGISGPRRGRGRDVQPIDRRGHRGAGVQLRGVEPPIYRGGAPRPSTNRASEASGSSRRSSTRSRRRT